MGSPFKLELNLQRVTLIRVAVNFWEQPYMKNKIKTFFKRYDSYSISRRAQEQQSAWINILFSQMSLINLPDSIKDQLMYVIRAIGGRLFDWLKQTVKRLEQSKKTYPTLDHYLDNLHWKTFGTIDGAQTFQSLYNGVTDNDVMDVLFMFEEACDYCLEEYIQPLWNRFSIQEKEAWSLKMRLDDVSKIHHLIYWRSHVLSKPSHLFTPSKSSVNYSELYGCNQRAKEDALRSCVLNGNEVAVEFFFRQMSENKKIQVLMETAEQLVSERETHSCDSFPLEDECTRCTRKYIDILVFFMKEMTEENRLDFLMKHKIDVLEILFGDWPWQYLFFQMLESTWDFFTIEDYQNLHYNILQTIREEYECIGIKKCTSLRMLHETWERSPVQLKRGIVDNKLCSEFSKVFLSILRETSFLTTFINDEDVAPIRQDILNTFSTSFYKLMIRENYPALDNFMLKILPTIEERISFKKNLDTPPVVKFFVLESQYDSLKTFIKWRFSSDDERVDFINYLKTHSTCISVICEIWRRYSMDTIKIELEKFFEWLSVSESEMADLKHQLESSESLRNDLRWWLKNNHSTKSFELFLSYCTFTSEEFERLKSQVQQAEAAERRERREGDDFFARLARRRFVFIAR